VEEVEEVQSEGLKAQMNEEEVLDADVLIQTALSALSGPGLSGPSEEDLERERTLVISEEKVYVYAYKYMCIYICMYIYMNIKHINKHVYKHTCRNPHTQHVYTHTCTHPHTQKHI
jgi:hypothetical protein